MLATKQKINQEKKIKTQFLAEVVFGRPSKDCTNFGICRIDYFGSPTKNCNCKNADAQAIVSIFEQDYIELDFLKASLSKAVYQKFFAKKTFLIEEDYLQETAEQRIYIAKGLYPIKENNSLIKVIFQPFQ